MRLYFSMRQLTACVGCFMMLSACGKKDNTEQGTIIARHFDGVHWSSESHKQGINTITTTLDSSLAQQVISISGWGTSKIHLLDQDIERYTANDSIIGYGGTNVDTVLQLTYYKHNDSIYINRYVNYGTHDSNSSVSYWISDKYYSIK